MSSKHWTPEQRAAQAERIRTWRPWEKSTGPKTEAGKERAKMNGFKGGYRAEVRALSKTVQALLREQRELLQKL